MGGGGVLADASDFCAYTLTEAYVGSMHSGSSSNDSTCQDEQLQHLSESHRIYFVKKKKKKKTYTKKQGVNI